MEKVLFTMKLITQEFQFVKHTNGSLKVENDC